MNAELIMQNLRIVSMVSEQDKLVTNPKFGLRPATTLRALMRWFYRENRETDLQNLRSLFGAAICLAQLHDATSSMYRPHVVGGVNKERLVEVICKALDGLHILKRTYHDDQEICAKLDLLTQEVSDHVQALQRVERPDSARCGSASPSSHETSCDTYRIDAAPPEDPPPSSPPSGS